MKKVMLPMFILLAAAMPARASGTVTTPVRDTVLFGIMVNVFELDMKHSGDLGLPLVQPPVEPPASHVDQDTREIPAKTPAPFSMNTRRDLVGEPDTSPADIPMGVTEVATASLPWHLDDLVPPFGMMIDWEEKGYGTILSQVYFSAASGVPSEQSNGEAYPLCLETVQGETAVKHEFVGVKTRVIPSVDGQGIITSDLKLKVSQMRTARLGNGASVPFFVKGSLDRVVRSRNGDTVIMAGMIQPWDIEVVERTPFWGDIWGLGDLFFTHKSPGVKYTEIVILFTPWVQREFSADRSGTRSR